MMESAHMGYSLQQFRVVVVLYFETTMGLLRALVLVWYRD